MSIRTVKITPTVGNLEAIVLELESGRLVACEFSSCRISTSEDGGETWTERKASVHPNANPRTGFIDSNGNIYFSKGLAGQSGLLFRSADDGITWSTVLDTKVASPSQYSNALWFMAEHSNGDLYINEYSFGNDQIEGWRAVNVYKSTDGGVTWSVYYTHPTTMRHLHMIAIDSNDVAYLSFAHPDSGYTDAPATHIFDISGPTGALSTLITPQETGGGMCGFVEADDGSLLFASDSVNTAPGIYRFNGTAWVNVLSPNTDLGIPDGNFLTIAKGRYGVIYTIDNERENMYASPDNGQTWVHLNIDESIVRGNGNSIRVGLGPIPYIYWSASIVANYRRLPDYTKEELKALYTSTLGINGTITML